MQFDKTDNLLCSMVTNQIAFDQRDSKSISNFELAMDHCCQALVSRFFLVSKLETLDTISFYHGLFTNGWETRSHDMWKPVSNRTPGIMSKIWKLGGGTPALLRPVGTLQDFALLDMGKNDSSSVK